MEVAALSLILHMKIPGAIVAASDCRITGTEPLFVPVQSQKVDEEGKKTLDLGKSEDLNPQKKALDENTIQVPFGHYDYVKTDSEQKTFHLRNKDNKSFAVSYCGNANLGGYPASYQILMAIKNMTCLQSTIEIAEQFNQEWEKKNINTPPSLLISGFNYGKPSVLELKTDGTTFEHFDNQDSYGITYHGDKAVVNALIGLGNFQYSLFRLQDAIDFCGTLITTTAKIQSFQKRQQTVSEDYDLLVITENQAEWIKRSTFELK